MRENVLKTNKVFQQYFSSQKILPILTIEELDSCNFLRDIFLENGIKVFEITLRTKVALEAINFMSKNKIQLTPDIDVDSILATMADKYKSESVNQIDGVKVDFENSWVHLRKSNTEPIIRIYTEAPSQVEADALAESIMNEIKAIATV